MRGRLIKGIPVLKAVFNHSNYQMRAFLFRCHRLPPTVRPGEPRLWWSHLSCGRWHFQSCHWLIDRSIDSLNHRILIGLIYTMVYWWLSSLRLILSTAFPTEKIINRMTGLPSKWPRPVQRTNGRTDGRTDISTRHIHFRSFCWKTSDKHTILFVFQCCFQWCVIWWLLKIF